MIQVISEINVMIDFETLGLRPNANVRSLGAVVFTPELAARQSLDNLSFYSEIALDIPQNNRYIDLDTWKWWKEKAETEMPNGTVLLYEAVESFNTWLKYVCPEPHNLILWSNGTDFDIPILYSLYDTFQLTPYWAYNNVKDYRTLRKLFPMVTSPEFIGTKHNAYDDAWNEANHCAKILHYIEMRHG